MSTTPPIRAAVRQQIDEVSRGLAILDAEKHDEPLSDAEVAELARAWAAARRSTASLGARLRRLS